MLRVGMLREAAELFVTGDVSTGKLVLRNYVDATIGFPRFADRLGKQPKTLMRMLSASGNPTAANLFAMLAAL
ncbi:MAG: hypothetical protein H7Y08_09095 [Rhizobiaceae bacterium]|nr:hypothetical protein [Rhizobiaceae bacterium]